ncbi:DUF4760 domain-containing protein [Calothrix sp. NIES-2098]|uniref:DUF4760 domain-containing protein n=1 Tax=Calothrix sp. NIES-2098 TaxID=1954171 RepID=UPI000B616983|nr:hypothetical protein NIES2098_35720 [Calothrix sp. NIES-2098]
MANRKKKPGEILGFDLIVSITVGSAALFFSALTIILFIFNKNIDREILKFIVTTVGVSGGITSAFYVGESFRENIKYKKEDRAMMYISAWTSPQFAEIRKSLRKVRDLIKTIPEDNQSGVINQELQKDPDLGEDIVTILNFLEEIAVCVKNDLIDEAIIYDYFQIIVKRVCRVFKIWVEEQRLQRGNKLYICLFELNDRWEPK